MRTKTDTFILIRFFSGILTALPAAVWCILILISTLISISTGSDYFWKTYLIVGGIFLGASLALGFIMPALFPTRWKRHPMLWLFGQGMLAWLVAVLILGLVNLTPLCVGQDNGDGHNDLALCMLQTVMVLVVFSPLEFMLLCLTALPGGWLIERFINSRGI